MSNKRQYKGYSQEFKEEAIALATEQGYSVPDAAASLGIRPNQLYSWKQKQEAAKGDGLLSVDERSELLALRYESALNPLSHNDNHQDRLLHPSFSFTKVDRVSHSRVIYPIK